MSAVLAVMATASRILEEVVEEAGAGGDLCLVSLMPGSAVPYLYGTEQCGGMAWVRLDSAFPTAAFPQPSTDVDNCATTLGMTAEVGIIRPAFLVEEGSNYEPPDAGQQAEMAIQQYADLDLMRLVLQRLAADIDDAEGEMIVGTYRPTGPDGGIVGGGWNFTLTVDEAYE